MSAKHSAFNFFKKKRGNEKKNICKKFLTKFLTQKNEFLAVLNTKKRLTKRCNS